MYSEDEFIRISLLQHYVFCRRRAALTGIELIWSENTFTVDGQIIHERAHSGVFESRNDVRISRALPLCSHAHGISGMADVVEFHRTEDGGVELTGVKGRWTPFPIEYKRGEMRESLPYEIQLCAQNLCLEEMLKVQIERGAIYWAKSGRRQDVEFDYPLRSKTINAIDGLRELLTSGVTPMPRYENKCRQCSLFDSCMPGRMAKNDVGRYWKTFFDTSDFEVNKNNEKTSK